VRHTVDFVVTLVLPCAAFDPAVFCHWERADMNGPTRTGVTDGRETPMLARFEASEPWLSCADDTDIAARWGSVAGCGAAVGRLLGARNVGANFPGARAWLRDGSTSHGAGLTCELSWQDVFLFQVRTAQPSQLPARSSRPSAEHLAPRSSHLAPRAYQLSPLAPQPPPQPSPRASPCQVRATLQQVFNVSTLNTLASTAGSGLTNATNGSATMVVNATAQAGASAGYFMGGGFTPHDFRTAPEVLTIRVDRGSAHNVTLDQDMPDVFAARAALAAALPAGVTVGANIEGDNDFGGHPSAPLGEGPGPAAAFRTLLVLESDATGAASAVEVLAASGEHARRLFAAFSPGSATRGIEGGEGFPPYAGYFIGGGFTAHDFRGAPEELVVKVDGQRAQRVTLDGAAQDVEAARAMVAGAGLTGVAVSVDEDHPGVLMLKSEALGEQSKVELLALEGGEHARGLFSATVDGAAVAGLGDDTDRVDALLRDW
jgi:hypothetical protein